jgi:hypothetical protein
MPVVNRAPAALVGTSMAFEAPKGPALPFANYGGQVAADPAKPVHGALADSAARPRPEGPRETTKGATPGAAPATTTPSAIPAAMKGPPAALTGTSMAATPTKGAPTPFTPRRARPTTATVELPAPVLPAPPAPVELTLEQYASLQVELARAQADVPAILARYRIGAEQRAALDAHWTARLAASVGMQTAFDAARAAYEAWLLASPRS